MEVSLDTRPLAFTELFARTARILLVAPVTIVFCSVLQAALVEVCVLTILDESVHWIAMTQDLVVCIAVLGGTEALFGGIVALAVSDLYTGRAASFGKPAREIAGHGVSIFVTGALATVAVLMGFALLVIPGALASLRWIYLAPVMAVERRYGTAALRRSRELGRARSVSALVLALTSVGSTLLLTVLPGEDAASRLAGLGASALASAWLWTLIAVGYLDVRTRSETSFSGEVLAEQRAGMASRLEADVLVYADRS
jgi:hypothetical protein